MYDFYTITHPKFLSNQFFQKFTKNSLASKNTQCFGGSGEVDGV